MRCRRIRIFRRRDMCRAYLMLKRATVRFFLMEMRGIEPLSEKSSSGLSTGVSRLLNFPLSSAGAQAFDSGIFFLYGRFKRKQAAHIYHCVTPASRPWSSVKGRSRTQAARATLLVLAFIFKITAFIEVPHLCPLIRIPAPRRNHYIPE